MGLELVEVDEPKLNISMSNQLVRMAHGLTLPEKRVVAMCLARLVLGVWLFPWHPQGAG